LQQLKLYRSGSFFDFSTKNRIIYSYIHDVRATVAAGNFNYRVPALAKTARCVRALETPAGDGGSSSIEHRESFIHSMMLRAAGRQGWLLAVVGLLGLIRSSAAQSDEPPCADDPDGSLAAFGGCAAVVSMGCDLDLNTVSPDTPVGTIVSGLCPVSCDACPSAGQCVDVADGDPALGELDTCAAVVAAADGNCYRVPGANADSMQPHCTWDGICDPTGCERTATCLGDAAVCHTDQEVCEDYCGSDDSPATWCSGGDGTVASATSLIGEVCPHSCGWCAEPDRFLKFENIAAPYCVTHQPAFCIPVAGHCDYKPEACGEAEDPGTFVSRSDAIVCRVQ
jgi:hypothetical protein